MPNQPNRRGLLRSTGSVELVTAAGSDEALAPATAEGFAEWVRPHLTAMRRVVARLAKDADADDTVQDALIRAWSKRKQFDPQRGTPAAWLLAIAADQARQVLRRRRPLTRITEVPAKVRSMDEAVDIEYAIANLPPRQRLAVDCFYFAGLSIAETAAVMRCAEGTVKSTLSDARDRLRPLLEVRDA
jgi:RNA polymerase sigma factor (sigma-70 family)